MLVFSNVSIIGFDVIVYVPTEPALAATLTQSLAIVVPSELKTEYIRGPQSVGILLYIATLSVASVKS